ncbi:dTDP-4-dehydrorhamnose reductase [Bradyrhizobium sp. LHD-71]|uniref:dTDP-4-dehydrorhamnose reductase n=1 Tax=Bradyrhizobium sp. LHD-71 TaxID=3072141 RepID=UPI00280E06B0|nr:dTDP-4-dehydrorhamnose reductase [Bradyrhizobium sp. LHD-71]MDQ8728366.1 dTDP-4-dehydrorhamnose reductase [Bradyrhizobium sp. LHD-71]
MRLAVTGRNGQIVQSLMERVQGTYDTLLTVARPEIDLLHPDGIASVLDALRPDVVVNAAAYTAVDAAEDDREAAFTINAAGAAAVAAATARLGIPVIQLSTDYVFDGRLERAYREDDQTAPLGVYGSSKLAGEQVVAAANPRHVVLRMAWVYSPFGKNFVRTMLNLARQRDEISVVDDQHGTPGNALDLADGILAVARNLHARPHDQALYGVFHLAAAGHTTWAQFAEAIFAVARQVDGPAANVRRITTAEYPTPARRPANSRLDGAKLAKVHGVELPHWQRSLPACVERLVIQEFSA